MKGAIGFDGLPIVRALRWHHNHHRVAAAQAFRLPEAGTPTYPTHLDLPRPT
jgi:hypothetical protein